VYDPGTDYEYSRALASQSLADGGFYYEGGLWKYAGEALPKLKIYLRLDDPNRRTAGEYLVGELRALGFGDSQLDVKITERTVCYQYVMVLYDFSIYTGGWSLGADPDSLYDLYNSKYGYNGWGAPEVGWAPNYPGCWRDDYDYWSAQVKYAPDETALRYAAWNATKIFWENEFIVALWSASAVKAYKTGSTGVVNMDGYGVDGYYTFMRMSGAAAADSKIDYGFKSEPEQLHPICSQWLWDWNALGLVIDGLIGRNPYRLSEMLYYQAICVYVSVWPNSTAVKSGDSDVGTALVQDPQLKFVDYNRNGVWDIGEDIFKDRNNDNLVDAGDTDVLPNYNVTASDCCHNLPLTFDPLLRFVDTNLDGVWDCGEKLYYDTDNSLAVSAGDLRIAIGGTKLIFTLRDNMYWQDGNPVTVDDIVFSWNFTKACGAGVAWNYATVADMRTSFVLDRPTRRVEIQYNVVSMFCKWWAGGLPILPKYIWEAHFPDWNTPTFNPSTVRTYHPWEVKLNETEGGVEIPGHPGEYFSELIGHGPWIFPYNGWTKGESLKFYANTNYYMPPAEIENNVVHSFWKYKGDVNGDLKISGADVLAVIAAYNSKPGDPNWNSSCDFSEDKWVGPDDLDLVTGSFGMVAG